MTDHLITILDIIVPGEPKGQPRTRVATCRRRRGRLIPLARPIVFTPKSAEAWKTAIVSRARLQLGFVTSVTLPILLSCEFVFPRPLAHYVGGRRSGAIKSNAPIDHNTKPDMSNLLKGLEDALTTAGVWKDDCRVSRYGEMIKRYIEPGEEPHTRIVVKAIAKEMVEAGYAEDN